MNFNEKYNRKDFLDFLQNQLLPDDFVVREESLDIDFKTQYIKEAYILGKIDSLDLKIYEIKHGSESDPRVSITNESFRLMQSFRTKKALAIFTSSKSKNYRLSVISIELDLEGRKVTKKYSNPKRYSYYLGPDAKTKTPEQYLIKRGQAKNFNDLLNRFSVEVVTKEFFDKFRNWFDDTKGEFEKLNKSICLGLRDKYSGEDYKEQVNKFSFTFLGRLIFIYFIQRKGWVEDNKNFIKEFIEDRSNLNLYIDFFQPLFFDVFAKKEEERPKDTGERFKNTPYLNGGLFERSKLEEENPLIYISDKFIRNLILDFFEIYNFTIDENTATDQEVSIDPEMLGKVFENTLEEEERGKKGTFYTPREIVTFMVKDSLLQFLINETKINELQLKELIFDDSLGNLTKDQIREIDGRLESIKVLDPAVGSAAFPVEMMNNLVRLRKNLDVKVGKNINEIDLKKNFIKNNLYGVDIDSGAIEIAKLRLWLALIVDYDRSELEALPNLDFQFRLGNSLQERVAGFEIVTKDYLYKKMSIVPEAEQLEFIGNQKSEQMRLQVDSASELVNEMIGIVDRYFGEENVEIKKQLQEQFDEIENKIFNARIKDLKNEADDVINSYEDNDKKVKLFQKKMSEIYKLERMVKEGVHKLFIPALHFADVYKQKKGFDIVIGNPPYGVKVDDDIKDWHELDSKDSYGVFISTSIKRFLKPGGVLSFIVSDTWLTIKTHFKLRKQVLSKQLHKIIRLNQDCFDATVNACIINLTKSINKNTDLIVADLTNIATRAGAVELREKLYDLEGFVGNSTPRYAVYKYNQDLIKTNSNLPIFVGSPKLFKLMNNTTCETIEKEIEDLKKKVKVRQINFNGKVVGLVRFGDIADVKVGLQTGDNKYYLYQNPEVSGNYKSIEDYKEFLLTEEDLEKIRSNEDLRLKIIERGIHKTRSEKNFDSDLWFKGRYIIPYDKGGESDTKSGWLPNYYVPTNYYVDWSTKAVKRLKTYKIADRIRDRNENKEITKKYKNTNAAVIRNKEFYFKEGITFSITGIYAPTFRLNSMGTFDVKGSYIDTPIDKYFCLGILTSKVLKIISKVFIYNCVDMQVDAIKEIPFYFQKKEELIQLVKKIIKKQKQNLRYNYLDNEQKEIDKIVYEMYGLNEDDIKEVETWYARRYPKLAQFTEISIKSNLKIHTWKDV